MTDYNEEQTSELETLRCIYPEEEFTEISQAPPCFQIHVLTSDDTNSMNADVQFTYPPTYPDVVPGIAIVSHGGLSEQQMEELETHLVSVAKENLGIIMIFTLVSAVQDRLSELLDLLQQEKDRKAKEKAEELERIENEKFFGTIVTKENFLEWRKKFDEEMRAKKSRDFNVETIGLTGRKMFENDSSLALSDARFLTEASELVSILPLDNVEVDESLFQDMDDLQI